MNRIAAFRTFIARSPSDPFPRYGLAMEFRSQGDKAAAKSEFNSLMQDFPEYVPCYLMAGGNLSEMGEVEAAKAVFRAGIAVAQRKGDLHAKSELEDALTSLGE